MTPDELVAEVVKLNLAGRAEFIDKLKRTGKFCDWCFEPDNFADDVPKSERSFFGPGCGGGCEPDPVED